jgi:predicted ATPase
MCLRVLLGTLFMPVFRRLHKLTGMVKISSRALSRVCIGLSIRQAAESAKASALEGMSVTATISYDRASAMGNASGSRPGMSGGFMGGGFPGGSMPEGMPSDLPSDLSDMGGGQQQRAAIVRALSYDPDIILADEPTGNLDRDTQKEIMDIFRELASRGKCVILVSHSPEVAQMCDKRYELTKISRKETKKGRL